MPLGVYITIKEPRFMQRLFPNSFVPPTEYSSFAVEYIGGIYFKMNSLSSSVILTVDLSANFGL